MMSGARVILALCDRERSAEEECWRRLQLIPPRTLTISHKLFTIFLVESRRISLNYRDDMMPLQKGACRDQAKEICISILTDFPDA